MKAITLHAVMPCATNIVMLRIILWNVSNGLIVAFVWSGMPEILVGRAGSTTQTKGVLRC